MGAKLRLVRRRIGTVQSIAKITRAQELIASSRIVRAQQQRRAAAPQPTAKTPRARELTPSPRIVRAQQQLRAAEPYARELTRAVESVVSRSATINHPFTEEPENPSRAAVLDRK